MRFFFILFFIIVQLKFNFSLLENDLNIKNECLLEFETDDGIKQCLNQKCSELKDPLRLISSFNQNGRCFLHYLKLSFTNYDLFRLFIEYQTKTNHSLTEFYSNINREFSMLEIQIDIFYPFNENLILSETMLNKLGGNINILIIEIERWYLSSRSIVQIIENNLIEKQSFEEITIIYKCILTNTIERIFLAKYFKDQEQSTCPTQIQISFDSFRISNQTNLFNNQIRSLNIIIKIIVICLLLLLITFILIIYIFRKRIFK